MAWNEPGGGKDPWGSGGGGGQDGPPDLDEALRKMREKFGKFMGGGDGGSGNGGGAGGPGFGKILAFVPVILVVLALLWGFMGIYQVEEKERGIVLRFGVYQDTVMPGLHWNPPLIDKVTVVNSTEEREYRTSARDLMLTEDENIVDLQIVVHYNVPDPKAYVLNVRDPDTSVRHATNSAVRHVVGSSRLNAVLSIGREQVGIDVHERLQTYLDNYTTGIHVVKVNVLDAKPPEAVRDAYDDVIKAREDQERVVSEAEAYANAVIPEARGRAQRMIEEAQGYQSQVVARAQGDARRFESLLAEYQRAPEVTRQRLYLDSVQDVMASSTKVMINARDSNNILYLPLDKAMEGGGSGDGSGQVNPSTLGTIADEVVNRLRDQSSGSQRRGLR